MHQPDSTPPPLLTPGVTLGKYKLIRRLAIGGMAEIYLAQTSGIEGFEKLVVLKRILPQYGENAEFVKMFLNEARLAATLHHPNIAQVYDIGVADGNYFFTMEFVHGQNLREILRKSKKERVGLPLENAISIAIGICAGLHRAHEKRGSDGELLGIVHRDVSPANVLVSYDGCPKVVDFGIAKAARGDMATNSQSLKGKISYMSPEQCMGQALDRRSDIFAIGNILYELTTGKRLYSKKDGEYVLIRKIVESPIEPPSRTFAEFPPALEAIIMRALEKHPDDRYPTAEAMQLDLEEFAQENKLSTSAIRVARFLSKLFAKQVGEWKAARDAGATLEEHVAKTALFDREIVSAADLAMNVEAADFEVTEITPSEPFFPARGATADSSSSSDRADEHDDKLSELAELESAMVGDRNRRRRTVLAIVAVPFVAIALFIGISALGDDPTSAPEAVPASVPQQTLRAPAADSPEPSSSGAEARALNAEPEGSQAADSPNPVADAVKATEAETEAVDTETEAAETETTAQADTTATASKARKNKRRPPRRSNKKSRQKPSKPKPKPEREKKWDQKSPLLPP